MVPFGNTVTLSLIPPTDILVPPENQVTLFVPDPPIENILDAPENQVALFVPDPPLENILDAPENQVALFVTCKS